MRVIVTRPAAQAAQWVQELRQRCVDAAALPLIEIAPMADPAPLLQAWTSLAAQRLVVFVSPNAARAFFALRPARTPWPPQVWAAATGPGTSRELLSFGVASDQILEPAPDAPQMDSEALWAQLQRLDWRDARVLMVRGETGRDWLGDTLGLRGAQVAHVSAYRRVVPVLDSEQQAVVAEALRQPHRHGWLFSSSQAVANLALAIPQAAAVDWARSWALGTHPRIAERAAQAGFGRVSSVRPLLEAVVACIQSTEL